jgi:transposase, IS30 family
VQQHSDRIDFDKKISSKKKVLHMVKYTQVKETERMRIYRYLKQGYNQSRIAQAIDRSKSTISRELARNSDWIGYLYPRDAQKKTENRKARYGTKLSRNRAIREYMLAKAKLGWSPKVIAGCWSKKHPDHSISGEAIYQFAYRQENRHLELWKLFPKSKPKRGMKRRQQQTVGITQRVSIHNRPVEIESRATPGHYEADLMFNSGSQSANVLTIVERKSRIVKLVKHESKQSKPIIESLAQRLGPDAQSCTFDNGKEFALHYKLGIPTFFCDPAAPWQKGSVENMNGLLRRYLPFELKPHLITQEYLDQIADKINNIPRQKLGFLTPYQVFKQTLGVKSRMKSALPAVEASFYQNTSTVALQY